MKFASLVVVSILMSQAAALTSEAAAGKKTILVEGPVASSLYHVLVNDLGAIESQGINGTSIHLIYLDVVLKIARSKLIQGGVYVSQNSLVSILDTHQIPAPTARIVETDLAYETPAGGEISVVTDGQPAAKLYSVLKSIGVRSDDSSEAGHVTTDTRIMTISDVTCSIEVHQPPTCTLVGNTSSI